MADLIVHGGRPLIGKLNASANKNAVLPILCASLISLEPVTLDGVPDISDVRIILEFFMSIGSRVDYDPAAQRLLLHHGAALDADGVELPSSIRSAVLLLPPLLHRFGTVRLPFDAKGCTLGQREIDPHIDLLRDFGTRISEQAGSIILMREAAWRPLSCWPDYASVTTTENFLVAAAVTVGRSTMVNAACEPHVQELCAFLALLGVGIEGVGTSTLHVTGGHRHQPVTYQFAEDYHEVATFLALGAITGGKVSVRNSRPDLFPLLDRTFAKFGVRTEHVGGWSVGHADRLAIVEPFTRQMVQKVEAAPWPYVPADLLPIFLALGVRAEGSVLFWNKVYEGALGWTSELAAFGARVITCDPHRVVTMGGLPLSPAEVQSPYIIRVAIALLMVALSVEGRSIVRHADPIRRAHPHFIENIVALGGDIAWAA